MNWLVVVVLFFFFLFLLNLISYVIHYLMEILTGAISVLCLVSRAEIKMKSSIICDSFEGCHKSALGFVEKVFFLVYALPWLSHINPLLTPIRRLRPDSFIAVIPAAAEKLWAAKSQGRKLCNTQVIFLDT